MSRDPRISPVKGDVLIHCTSGAMRRVVYVERDPSMVQVMDGIYRERERRPTLRQYRRWAEGALIHKRGDAK